MPPTSKKLTGHICFGSSVYACMCASIRVCIHSSRTVHARVLKFHIWIPYGKIFDTHFFFVRVISLSGVLPLGIKSKWNLVHAISYEPCMLGFWNFIYGFLMEKKLTCIFLLVRVTSLSGVMPLWKNQNEILSARYLGKVFELGAWNLVSL